MKVSEFANSYKTLNSADLKNSLVTQHIKRTYAPIAEKNALLKKLADDSVMVDKNGIPYLDMVANKIHFIYSLIILYTDLEIDKAEDGKNDVLGAYDLLQETGVIEDLCDKIGTKEINELTFVNKEVLDTWHNKNASTRAYLATLTDKAVRTFVELSEILGRQKVDINTDSLLNFMGITPEVRNEQSIQRNNPDDTTQVQES